ncbi:MULTISPECIES: hypothetical protein [Brevundimonas]|uniref:UDP-N-acetylglucosamine 4,6-dehydratase n=1 Tax=Brevundimonas abyssalis TAR-001 TaxID=1391729 RepID=A0A8E0TRU2_9CAUL|nr:MULTISPECIES: hypothetical protein [Brevundimonas]GAD59620.1 UDP-N-acetylglucosamine 4,6-dehydratase [Brevundimonas abyssalis TAR-001]
MNLTLEFDDHYVLSPTIRFHRGDIDYAVNRMGEKGTPVAQGFEYNSGSNEIFLTPEQIVEFNRAALARGA